MVLCSATRRIGSFGFTQRPGVEYDDTFSPVVKPATARTVLSLALSILACAPARCQECISSWHSDRDCLLQPANRVCGLQLSRYGLPVEQVSIWFEAGSSGMVLSVCHFLLTLGFVEAKSDTSLFIYHHADGVAYLLLCVDDIVLTASSP
jgi:hypothetical protein